MGRKENRTLDNYRKAFPQRLRELLVEKGITQQALALEIGRTRQTVSLYCDGSAKPDWETIACIAKYFGVSSDYLLGLTDTVTFDKDLRAACDFIGLNESAVIAIKKQAAKRKDTMNKILSSNQFDWLCRKMKSVCEEAEFLCTADNALKAAEKAEDLFIGAYAERITPETMFEICRRMQNFPYYVFETSQALLNLLDNLCGYYRAAQLSQELPLKYLDKYSSLLDNAMSIDEFITKYAESLTDGFQERETSTIKPNNKN